MGPTVRTAFGSSEAEPFTLLGVNSRAGDEYGTGNGRKGDGNGPAVSREEDGIGGEAWARLGQSVGSGLGPVQTERWVPAEQQRELRLQTGQDILGHQTGISAHTNRLLL